VITGHGTMSADEDPFDDIFGDFESGENDGHPKREAVAQGGLSEGGFVGDGDAAEEWNDFDQGEITATDEKKTSPDPVPVPVDDNTDGALGSVGHGGHATAVEKSTNPDADLTGDDNAEVVGGDFDQGKFAVADRKSSNPDLTPVENDVTDEEWGNFDQVETTVVGEELTILETVPVHVEDDNAGEKEDRFDKLEFGATDEKSSTPGLIPVHFKDYGGIVCQKGLAAADEKSSVTTVTVQDNSGDEEWGIFVQDHAATGDKCISPESALVPVEDDKAEEEEDDVDRRGEAAADEKNTGHDSVPASNDDAEKELGNFSHGEQAVTNAKSTDSEARLLPIENNSAEEKWGDFDQGGKGPANEKSKGKDPVPANDEDAEEEWGDFDQGELAAADEKSTSQDPVLVNDDDAEEGWGDFDQDRQAPANEKSTDPDPLPVEDDKAVGEWGNFDQAEIASADEESPFPETVPVPVPVENGNAEQTEGNVHQGGQAAANENSTGQDPVPANDDSAEEEWGDFDRGGHAPADEESTGQDPVPANDDGAEEEWGDFDQGGNAAADDHSTDPDLAPLPVENADAEEKWGNFDQAEIAAAGEKHTSMDIVPTESDKEWGNFDQDEQRGADGKMTDNAPVPVEADNPEEGWGELDEGGDGIGNGEEEDWGDFGDAEINETGAAEPKLKPQDFGAESFQVGGSNDEADEWGDFAEENEEIAILGADDEEEDGDWGDFEEEKQAPRVQTIFDLEDMKFRSVLDRIFSQPVDAVDIIEDRELPDDFVPTPMSFLDDLLKSGQGRSSDGLLFWGPSKCSACSSLLRFLSKSCLVCGKSTGMVDWKGKGRVGPTVESKLRAALRLPKDSKLELDDTDSKVEDQFSPTLTPKRNVPYSPETSKGGFIPSLDISENMTRESDEHISSLYDVSHNSSEVHAAGNTDLFGAFQSGSSPARGGAAANDVFSTFIGRESPVQRSGAKDEPVVDLLSQTLADFGFESSTSLSAPSTKQEDETQESALDSVLKVLQSVPKRGDSGTKSTGRVDSFPREIQDLIDQINVPIFMLSNVLVLPNDAKQEDFFAGVGGEHDIHDGERSPGLLLGMKSDTKNQSPQNNIEGMSAPFAMMESLRKKRLDDDGLVSAAEPQGLVKLSEISHIASEKDAFSNEEHKSLTGDTALKLNGDEPNNSVPSGADWGGGDFTTSDLPKEGVVSTLTGEEDSATSDTAEPNPVSNVVEENAEAEWGGFSAPNPHKVDVIEMAKLVGEDTANDTAGPDPVPSIHEDNLEAEWGNFPTTDLPKGDMIEVVKDGGEDTANSMPSAVENNAEAEWGDFTSPGLQNKDSLDITTCEHGEFASSTNESNSAPIAVEDNEEAEWGDFATPDP
jgi:hypothetical protein